MWLEKTAFDTTGITGKDALRHIPDCVRFENEAHWTQFDSASGINPKRVPVSRAPVEEVNQVFVKDIARCEAAKFVVGNDMRQHLTTGRMDQRQLFGESDLLTDNFTE